MEYENCRIDEYSQRMLLELHGEASVGTGELVRAAGFEEGAYQKVKYRMEEHLIPAGLVRELPEESSRGPDRARRFTLTRDGSQWVSERFGDLGKPATVDEAVEDAGEALKAANSAKESVQKYRKRVHRWQKKVKAVEEDVEELQRVHRTAWGESWEVEQLHEKVDELSEGLEEIEELEESVGEIEERVRVLEEEMRAVSEQHGELEKELTQLKRYFDSHQEEATRERRELEDRIWKVEQRQEEGLLSRLWPF